MSFVLFYILFWTYNVLFYAIGHNSKHWSKTKHIWSKIRVKQTIELKMRPRQSEAATLCILELKNQNSRVEAVALDSKISKITFKSFIFSFCLVFSPRYF